MIAIIVISWMAIATAVGVVVGRGIRLRDQRPVVRVPIPTPPQVAEVPEKVLV